MICELYHFWGVSFDNYELAQEYVPEGENKESFETAVKIFVECEFPIKNPQGLTPFEIATYFKQKNLFRLKTYKQQAVVLKEVSMVDTNTKEIFEVEDEKQIALENMGKMALDE